MRKTLTSLIILSTIIFSKVSKSQSFTPYLDSTSTWYDYYIGGTGITETRIHSIFYFDGDTFLLGNNYYKLFWSRNDSTWLFGNLSSVTDTNYYAGAFREDSLKRFYLIYANQTNENLFFDFNLSVGDTVPDMESNYGCNNPPMTVVSIDTVYLGSQPLKNFHFPPNWLGKTLIEGIGGTGGFIWVGAFCLHFESGSCLIAYKKGIDSLYINCGQGITGIAETTRKEFINIFPNPSSGYFTITFSDFVNKGSIEIYNTFGEKIVEEIIYSTNKKAINLKSISRGIYFVRVFDGEKSYCKKLIVEQD